MPRLAWYEADHKAFGLYMVSEDVAEPMHWIAGDIANQARLTAPVGRTGQYARSFRVDRRKQYITINDGEGSGKRRISEAYNEDGAASPIEFGTKRQRAQRILGRAAAKYGDPIGKLKIVAASWGGER